MPIIIYPLRKILKTLKNYFIINGVKTTFRKNICKKWKQKK